MPSVALCMIVKDVEPIIERCLLSVRDSIDEFVIVDTGSSDGTKSLIAKILTGKKLKLLDFNERTHPASFLLDSPETWNSKVPGPFTGKHMLADFGAARQFGWEKCESDYLLWIDSDDVVENKEKIPMVLGEMEKDSLDCALLNYDYSKDHQGNVTCRLLRERILRRKTGTRWSQPIHEVVGPIARGRNFDEVNIVHMRDKDGRPPTLANRNLKVLLHLKDLWDKDPKTFDARNLFYLATEERFIWPERALSDFEEYIDRSGWDEERAMAHMYRGGIFLQLEKYKEARKEFAQGFVEFPRKPEGWFGLAQCAYFKQDWDKVIAHTEQGFKVMAEEKRPSILFYDPLDRIYRPYVFLSAALVERQRWKDAVEACKKGLAVRPDDPHLKGNLEVAERNLAHPEAPVQEGPIKLSFLLAEPLSAKARRDITPTVLETFAIQMWKRCLEESNPVKALQLLASLPAEIYETSKIREARKMTEKTLDTGPKTSEKKKESRASSPGSSLDIILWTGTGWETWSPKSINTGGIGGSETAAIMMAKELAKLGHKVRMYGQHEGHEDIYEGVQYIDFRKLGEATCDVLISSRQPWAFDMKIEARAKILWVHDIHVGQPSAQLAEQILKADRILCLSEWHKKFFLDIYPYINPETVIVTRNGLDTSRFAAEPVKKGNRLIFSSSPNRGLDRLLDLLPRIQEEVPDTELHIYYGFETWEKIATAWNNQNELEVITHFKNRLKSFEGKGVHYHGRVNQKELAEAFLASKVWGYPTAFTETSCISAMEAQCAGCVPVSTVLAALPETVHHGFLLKPPNTSEVYEKAFVKRVISLLKDDDLREKYAKAGREAGMAFHGWDVVAKEWDEMLKKTLKDVADYPLVLYGKE